MFTSIDKAIVAILGGLATVAAMSFGVNVDWATPELLGSIGSVLSAILVYVVPNKEPEV
jgi:CBS-domain-containing membrane protein